MKKIVMDTRLTGWKNAGIGRYIENLAGGLLKLKEKQKSFYLIEVRPRIKHYSFEEQIKMPEILSREKPDLVHFPHFNVPFLYNKPFVVTIHDLLWHEQVGFEATTQSRWKYLIKYWGYRLVMRHAITGARAIIVPSNWVKQQLVKRFPLAEDKVKVICEGVVQSFKSLNKLGVESKLLEKFQVESEKYLIYTGSLYPHKNLKIVLKVLPEFPDLKLVIASSRNVFRDRFEKEIEKKNLTDQVILAGFVPDEELSDLYRNAMAFVFPSKSEGFGLPGLEAMAAGCPVISSNAGSLPEIYGAAAAYFNPENKEELIEKIREIGDNRGYREELIELGKERAKLFSWEKCAEETVRVYENCFNLRSNK